MTTPISNNNPTQIAKHQPKRPDERGEQAQEAATDQSDRAVLNQSEDAVSLSRAAEVLSQTPLARETGSLQSAEHASAVVQQIKSLFEANPAQALASQAGNVSSDIIGLLKAR